MDYEYLMHFNISKLTYVFQFYCNSHADMWCIITQAIALPDLRQYTAATGPRLLRTKCLYFYNIL